MSHKILAVNSPDTRMDAVPSTTTKSYRLEEIPPSQEVLSGDEILVPVAHFQKEVYSTFGHPFLIKVKDGERFESVKAKIQKHLDLPDKEFEKYRMCIVTMGRARYVEEMQHDTVRIREFLTGTASATANNFKPYIGLEHVNKNSKRPRYNYMEKAIKIYN